MQLGSIHYNRIFAISAKRMPTTRSIQNGRAYGISRCTKTHPCIRVDQGRFLPLRRRSSSATGFSRCYGSRDTT